MNLLNAQKSIADHKMKIEKLKRSTKNEIEPNDWKRSTFKRSNKIDRCEYRVLGFSENKYALKYVDFIHCTNIFLLPNNVLDVINLIAIANWYFQDERMVHCKMLNSCLMHSTKCLKWIGHFQTKHKNLL